MIKDWPESAAFAQITSSLIAAGHGFRFQARGRSMVPTIQDGNILHVAPVQGAKLKIGDIVLIRKRAEFKAHRIVSRRGKVLITRGDAGVEADGEVSCDQVLGVVIAVERDDHRIRLYGVRARVHFLARERWRRFRYRVDPQSKSASLP